MDFIFTECESPVLFSPSPRIQRCVYTRISTWIFLPSNFPNFRPSTWRRNIYISRARIDAENKGQFCFEECRLSRHSFEGGARSDTLAILELSKYSITKDINPFTVARHAPCAEDFSKAPQDPPHQLEKKKLWLLIWYDLWNFENLLEAVLLCKIFRDLNISKLSRTDNSGDEFQRTRKMDF